MSQPGAIFSVLFLLTDTDFSSSAFTVRVKKSEQSNSKLECTLSVTCTLIVTLALRSVGTRAGIVIYQTLL